MCHGGDTMSLEWFCNPQIPWFSAEFRFFLRLETLQYMPKIPIFNPFRVYIHTGSWILPIVAWLIHKTWLEPRNLNLLEILWGSYYFPVAGMWFFRFSAEFCFFLRLKHPNICLKHPYSTHLGLIFILEGEFPLFLMVGRQRHCCLVAFHVISNISEDRRSTMV